MPVSRRPKLPVPVLLTCLALAGAGSSAADWPMWRCNPARTGASPESLPENLHPRWVRRLPPVRPAFPHESRLHFDASYEPVVMGKSIFLGSPNTGAVTAWDTDTGAERWTFFTNGPVRFAPVAWRGKVIAGSDDGWLYCLDAAAGTLLWRLRGAPEDRPDLRHLGNARLISFWPVRGGPVVVDDRAYFAAGIWPMMGVFVVCADAETGRLLWRNDKLNNIAKVRIDHNFARDAALSPQGYLVAVRDKLLVPNGRSFPAGLKRDSGDLIHYVQGYRNGDCRVIATGNYAFVGKNGLINLQDFREVGSKWVEAGAAAPDNFIGSKRDLFEGPYHPYKMFPACDAYSALESGVVYGVRHGAFYAYDLSKAALSEYEQKLGKATLRPLRWDAPDLWRVPTPHRRKRGRALIKAGDRLYGHAGDVLLALQLPGAGAKPKIAWEHELEGTPTSLVAADGKLFVATKEGALHCFGAGEQAAPTVHELPTPPQPAPEDEWTRTAAELLECAGADAGYCVVLGLDRGRLVEELLRQSGMRVVGVDADRGRIDELRTRLVAAGLYGERAELRVGDPGTFPLPPYLASLIASESLTATDLAGKTLARQLFAALRPYGGALCLRRPESEDARVEQWLRQDELPGAEIRNVGSLRVLRRQGALPGSTVWTHESADAARSYYSRDELAKPPLGILWYGDGEDHGFFKTHDYGLGHKPQVVGGRVFALQQFSGTLFAYDAYTGLIHWKRKVNNRAVPFPWVKDGSYEWRGCGAGGYITRYASMPDGVYVAGEGRCVVLDPATGEPLRTLDFTKIDDQGRTPVVKTVKVDSDVVLIGVSFTIDRTIETGNWDSTMLVALDRESGQLLWKREAIERFNNKAVAVGHGLVFCIDSISPLQTEKWKRRAEGLKEVPSTVLALDARTGSVKWSAVTTAPHATYGIGAWIGIRERDDWLAYSTRKKLLLTGRCVQVHAFRASDGEPVWRQQDIGRQPVILRDDTFIDQSGRVFDLDTGEVVRDKSLFSRLGGCNYGVAGKHLALLRDSTVCWVDLDSGTKRFLRNMRSGCSASIVPADGLLNIPCFAPGCICNYPVQTAAALVHMPGIESWDRDAPTEMPRLRVAVNIPRVTTEEAEAMHVLRSDFLVTTEAEARKRLVGWWSFEDLSGGEKTPATTADVSGNGLDGRLSGGAGAAPGRIGQGLSCEAEQASVRTPYKPVLDLDESLTMSAWVKLSAGAAPWKKAVAGIVERCQAYRLCVNNVEPPFAIHFALQMDDHRWWGANSAPIVKPDEWTFLAGAYDASIGEQRLYVNGELANSRTGDIGCGLLRTRGGLSIGVRDSSAFINGVLDEVKVYSRPLSADLIRAEYEAGKPE